MNLRADAMRGILALSLADPRNALVARLRMIFEAHAVSSAADVGLQMKIFLRLAVSEMPVTL